MSGLLKVRDLRVRYPVKSSLASMLKRKRRLYVDVVHGVSLHPLITAKRWQIVGESGSGKTTLAMALCGLAPVLDGEVLFDGDSAVHRDKERIPSA